MADPLDVLRAPDAPVGPDPEFAARLRARIERALSLPKGVAMITDEREESREAATVGNALTPYLAVAGAPAAIDWYRANLGARLIGEPIVMPDGRIGHAELEIAGARVFLADEHPEIGVAAPAAGAGAAVSLHLEVADVDAVTAAAAGAGAVVEREPSDNPYGRVGVIRDPFGHRWMLNSAPAAPGEPARDGDIGYFSLWTPDVDRAADFYATVLGWSYTDAGGPSRMAEGGPIPHGIVALDAARREWAPWSGLTHPTLFCSYGVADLDAAVERVRTAGGQASDPGETPYGRIANCADDQGAPFALHENGPEARRPPLNGGGQGDIAYLTMQVVDARRARDFYGSLFGWTFTPGRVEEGWEPHDPAPMTGMHGGHDHAAQVPMYLVDDVAAAVGRVRASGGTSTEPSRQPYGLTAECTDDQGMPFSLGAL
ncbi:MAG TPA: VOC family protein [Streptosporangiaceae bacterium]|jgi:predicted enzyme related to lactoylglutathione lyase